MPSNLIVSYPSADLEKSTTFYTGLGMTLNPALSGETAACFAYDDRLQFMLIERETFEGFTEKEVADPATTAMVQFSISRDSREEIDTLTEAGLASGGTEAGEAQDLGFMYSRDLEDPDGNNLCFMWMAPEGSPEAQAADPARA